MQPASSASFVPESEPDWAAILGRRPSQPTPVTIPGVAGRSILVTGAGGFIGSEMVRFLAASGAAEIVLLEIAEQPLFEIFSEMTASGCGDRCAPVLGSICDRGLLRALLAEHRPDLILHAAALKHVPLMERNPFAAVSTNAIGTWTLAELAAECGVPRVVLISTDKAVAPHSIMGASKRIAELATLAHGFTAVRLVNVIGSPGSVGPIFADQIASGGPVTVTHPAARRFFFTLDQVVLLLAEAIGAEDAAGIFVPDSGEAVLIEDLARRILAAHVPAATRAGEIPIVFTEPRPGDKLDESLLAAGERLGDRAGPGLHRVLGPAIPPLVAHISALESAIAARDLSLLLHEVESLIPGYQPSALLRAGDFSHVSG